MSEWPMSFDGELEKLGYRVGWLHSDVYNVYDPRGNVIGVEKNIGDARTRAYQHHTSETGDLKLEVQRLRKRIEGGFYAEPSGISGAREHFYHKVQHYVTEHLTGVRMYWEE